MATATTEPVRLPPGPRIPKTVQGIALLTMNSGMFAALAPRFGSAMTVNLPILGQTVVISDPILIKDLFTTSNDLIERPTCGAGSIGQAFGPGSIFSLAGDELRERRRLVVPPFTASG